MIKFWDFVFVVYICSLYYDNVWNNMLWVYLLYVVVYALMQCTTTTVESKLDIVKFHATVFPKWFLFL